MSPNCIFCCSAFNDACYVFPSSESIFGYQGLSIQLYYTAGKLNTYLGLTYEHKIKQKQEGVSVLSHLKIQVSIVLHSFPITVSWQADDVIGSLAPKLQPGFFTNIDDFTSSLEKEANFVPFGELLSAYTVNPGNAGIYLQSRLKLTAGILLGGVNERRFEIYTCSIDEPGFRSYHERMQTFLLWYVDAASFIDVDDDRWRYFLM